MTIRVGVIILPDLRWREAARRWSRAEEYGFDHAWTYDHLGWRTLADGPWFDAVPTLVAAAGVTSRIGLGTMVASPNFRHPVHFAREVTTLDDLTGGRLLLGVGSGGIAGFDTTVLGQPPLSPQDRADRFAEFVELLDRLLTSDSTTWHGRFYDAVDARTTPGCVQQPRVPFVVAGRGPRAIELAARFGQGWVTHPGESEDLAQWWRGVARAMRRFRETGSAARTYLQLDSAPVFSLSSVDFFMEAAGRAAELGFTDILTHWPRPDGPYAGSETVLESVAAQLPIVNGGT